MIASARNRIMALSRSDLSYQASILPGVSRTGNDDPDGIAFAGDRLYAVDGRDDKVYAYRTSGQRDAAHDFHLDAAVTSASGIAFAGGRFYVTNDRLLNTESRDRVHVVESIQQSPELVLRSMSVSNEAPGSSFYFSGIDVNAGDAFRARTTALNRGTLASIATTLRFFRSDDRSVSSTDTQVGTSSVGALAADGTASQTVSLPAPSTAGTYYYGARVDSVSEESQTRNNCSGAVAVFGGGPFPADDLTISSATLNSPGVVIFGSSSISMTVTVSNDGPNESQPVKLRFSGGTLSYLDIPAIEPGESETFERHRVGAARLGTTTYRACIVEAPGEENADNNCQSRSVTYFLGADALSGTSQ